MLINLKETAWKIKTGILQSFETFQSSLQENKPEITDKLNHWLKAGKCCNNSRHVLLPWPVRVSVFSLYDTFQHF